MPSVFKTIILLHASIHGSLSDGGITDIGEGMIESNLLFHTAAIHSWGTSLIVTSSEIQPTLLSDVFTLMGMYIDAASRYWAFIYCGVRSG